MKLSYDDLSVILKNPSRKCSADALLKAVVQWVCYSREERKKYLNNLLKSIDLKKLSAEYLILMVEGLVSLVGSKASDDISNVAGSSETRATKTKKSRSHQLHEQDGGLDVESKHNPLKKNTSALHVYLTNNAKTKVLSSEDVLNWHSSSGFKSTVEMTVRNIALDNNLYCLSYLSQTKTQKFSFRRSVCAPPCSYLRNPPNLFKTFDMCGVGNNMYVHDSENLLNQIWHYDCEQNNWFPLPPPVQEFKDRFVTSCMTVKENVLYFFGGEQTIYRSSWVALDYDIGTNKWSKLPGPPNKYIHSDCVQVVYQCMSWRTLAQLYILG